MTADIARHSLAQTAPYQLGFDLEPGQLGREVRWIMDMKKVDTLMGMAGLGQSAKPAEPAKGPGSVSAKSPPKKRAWRLLSVMIGIVLAVAIMVIGPKEVGSFMAEAWKSMANSLRASEPMLDSDNTDVGVLPNDQDLYIELECSAT